MSRLLRLSGRGAAVQYGLLRTACAATRHQQFRGMQRVTWAVGRAFPRANRALMALPEGRIWIHLDDGYWVREILPGRQYERELRRVIDLLLGAGSGCLLDCGANIGYWSLVASSYLPAGHVLAVEASPAMYEQLTRNAAANAGRWSCVAAAVWSAGGEQLRIHEDRRQHAGNTVVGDLAVPGTSAVPVRTVTVDALAAELPDAREGPLVVKLDVEGAEIAAIDGARETLARSGSYLLYEDHGHDRTHRVSTHLLDLGMHVAAPGEDGSFTRIRSVRELDTVKALPYRGYNFVAVADPAALDVLAARTPA
ncbi:MAG TPA: FkbM family methyltransferase [Mycobacteriales bacterium]|jgi:FkbM family methyltransferase|nr:FkbM family methyltransferase [Mycobacteriales bacterium]